MIMLNVLIFKLTNFDEAWVMTLPQTSKSGTPRFELVDEVELGLNSTLAAALLKQWLSSK